MQVGMLVLFWLLSPETVKGARDSGKQWLKWRCGWAELGRQHGGVGASVLKTRSSKGT